MDDLVQFLRARLDEDAVLAEAASPGPWHPSGESDEVLAVDGITVADGFALSGRQLRATTDHIARHDPARVLAEVEAKRRLLDWLAGRDEWALDNNLWTWGSDDALCLLALPYADHPDYREEWKP